MLVYNHLMRRSLESKACFLIGTLATLRFAISCVEDLTYLAAGDGTIEAGSESTSFPSIDADSGVGDSGVLPLQETDSGSNGLADSGGSIPAVVDAAATREPEIFANAPDALYRFEALAPNSWRLVLVGAFDGCTNVIDIALDRELNLYGATGSPTGASAVTATHVLYKIDKRTAKCTRIGSGEYFNALSFLPPGILDGTRETLVGFASRNYARIDQTNGIAQTVSTIDGDVFPSGDLVSVEASGTYLTVKSSTLNCNDCIVELDPKTGSILKNWGAIGYDEVYGIAYWGGRLYGFTGKGQVIEIDLSLGSIKSSLLPVSLPKPFWGAASPTDAPVTRPN